ncbi:uncharacterized protein GGS25DRAFT_349000 [Hypoxylon fragiforme]|uniref:uncharacterized protein n=1 Tax=Hypoxylon fragiforme TaxID=63214 RepID=UPI0020C67751|nr:uncharacterized protein GGS25DRAFT_349000 [Hypoxylon fragiforme]KAI2607756.1 hypothetical protein GGS25DRAFT_349000 [Hypoxylon fragiforme]
MQFSSTAILLFSLFAGASIAAPTPAPAPRKGTSSNIGNGNEAAFEGQFCTDGDFDGVCQASGRCGLSLPPNEFSQVFISGQCGQ